MSTDLTTTDDLDLTVEVVADRATGRTAIGLGPDAVDALRMLLDAIDTRSYALVEDLGVDQDEADAVSRVAGDIKTALGKLPRY